MRRWYCLIPVLVLVFLFSALLTACAPPSYDVLMKEGRDAFARSDYALAEKKFDQAVRAAGKPGRDDARLAKSYHCLADTYMADGRAADARRLYRQALPLMEISQGEDSLLVAKILHALATLEMQSENLEAAEGLFSKSLKVFEKSGLGDDPEAGEILSQMADLHALQRNYVTAESEYKGAIAIVEASQGQSYLDLCRLYHGLANVLRMQDKEDAATEADQRASAVQIGGIKEKVHSLPSF